ncbi:MAG: RagB/SusD family nutrient uptake outer membrane protein, partial [Bacteroidota bacterium]
VGTYWAANYNVIFRANRVLENLDVVTDANQKAQFEGEAKFARALSHFNLVRAYGAVPLVDQVIIQTDTAYFGRTDVATVLSFIATDLRTAAGNLANASASDAGRATSGAASGLLAKVMLTQGDYAGAEGVLNGLIAGGEYALLDEYRDVFFNEMSGEILFAIPYKDDDANESQDFSFEMTIGGAVSGLNFVTDNFKSFADPLDTERAAVYYNPNNAVEVGKFLTQSADARLCGNDWIVLRYADVLLMHCEAIMAGAASTQDLDAIASYNLVRERVGLSTLAVDGSETLTKEMLSDERRAELAFENHRLYDLIRMGMAETVLGDFATANGFSFQATDLLLPLPQGEINVSAGRLTQNPGY